ANKALDTRHPHHRLGRRPWRRHPDRRPRRPPPRPPRRPHVPHRSTPNRMTPTTPAKVTTGMSRALSAMALAGAVGLSLFAAACGSSPGKGVAHIDSTRTTTSSSDSSGSRSPSDRRGILVAFSACMRKHGLPNFPDPKAVGHGYSLTIGNENGLDPNSPQFKAAQQVCKKLLPNGGGQSPQEQTKQLHEALKYAACIRSHGMPDYPDPKAVSGGGIELGEAPNAPQFKIAQRACGHLLPGGAG